MRRLEIWVILTTLTALFAGLGIYVTRDTRRSDHASGTRSPHAPPSTSRGSRPSTERNWAGSQSCRPCHEDQFRAWKGSHHGLAERPVDVATDRHAFAPTQTLLSGTTHSEFRLAGESLEVVTLSADNTVKAHVPKRVIGVDPLYQFVIPFEGGRYQVTEVAFDPAKKEWFNVYGDEDRKPHEWGFWASRGMTWNSMCASCHMTKLEKNYEIATDTYSTRWLEIGVGCEACHGPYQEHVDWYGMHPASKPWPLRPARSLDTVFDTCGSCHARRGELTHRYEPGEPFFDHYRLVLPDDPAIFYPDGQVLEEDYEFTSFYSSRMYTEGVRCINCHEPHSGKLRLQGNALCLSCHKGKIDPAAHSHHDVNGAGGQCVNCHMPLTTYMQRHPRRDHGFTIPDPLLTRELGIPNACNRCHDDRSVDWAIDAASKWYGERLERNTRKRARAVAAAQAGDVRAVPELQRLARSEKSPVWRAVAVSLLEPWAAREDVLNVLTGRLGDSHPLVRGTAIRALGPLGENLPQVAHLGGDVSRFVRIESAWSRRSTIDTSRGAGKELAVALDVSADQPTGALQRSVFYMHRGDLTRAEEWVRKAIVWDANSAPLYHALAVILSQRGSLDEAIDVLKRAEELDPTEAEYPYSRALALAEAGRLSDAIVAFERAVELLPEFTRAWYNLGLARIQSGDADGGLNDLATAEKLDPQNPEYPLAQATTYVQQERVDAARTAAKRALELAPGFEPAVQLLEFLDRR